jgi:hypothetical protein
LTRGFQVLSIAAIIRRERHDSPMTDEERQRAMDFIVAQQAKNSVDIENLNESHRRAEGRLDRTERIPKLLIKAGRRARSEMREQNELFNLGFARVTAALTALAEAQTRTEASIAHTDKRLDALIDIVRRGRKRQIVINCPVPTRESVND